MSHPDEVVILPDSDQAAKLITVTGWASRHGGFYGKDERSARLDGCTHLTCKCGVVIDKHGLSSCDACRIASERARYESLEYVEWDGETPLTLYRGDRYFFDDEEVFYYCEDRDIDPSSLHLMLCEPEYGREIDPEDWACDFLGDDHTLEEVSPEIYHAIEAVNAVIRRQKAEKKPLSWFMGNKRTSILKENES